MHIIVGKNISFATVSTEEESFISEEKENEIME